MIYLRVCRCIDYTVLQTERKKGKEQNKKLKFTICRQKRLISSVKKLDCSTKRSSIAKKCY